MREDRTGWIIVFDGTDRAVMGRELLPPRESKPSEVWSTSTKRKYTKSGKYARQTNGQPNEQDS